VVDKGVRDNSNGPLLQYRCTCSDIKLGFLGVLGRTQISFHINMTGA